MKISLLQLPITIGDRATNQKNLQQELEQAMAEKPDLILLPELWDIGFFPRPLDQYTDPEGQNARSLLSKLARQYQINIIGGSIAEATADGIKNTCYVFDRQGKQTAVYSKSHLFSPAKEDKIFTPGNGLAVFTLDEIRCGIAICYDLRFPELFRKLALADIDLLLLPAEWPTVRLDHWRCLTQARAIENQLYLAACNGSGSFANGMPLAGHSVVIDPWGRRLAEADDQPGIITADINLLEKEKIRSTINVFSDRRPELY